VPRWLDSRAQTRQILIRLCREYQPETWMASRERLPHPARPLSLGRSEARLPPGANEPISRLAFERTAGPKESADAEGGHFGLLYHPGRVFDEASRRQREFLEKHLA
jgi:hypothetical protein